MSDTILRDVVARLQEALAKPDMGGEFGTHRVRDYDIRILFETIKRYGGRKDWTPDEANIAELPAPVRRYVRQLQTEVQRWQQEAVRRRL